MPFPIVPVIAAAGSIISSIAANSAAKKQQKRANEYNTAMWEKQNAYNTPQEQMNRFMAAGMNPHLAYGQGNSGNAAPAPEFEAIAPQGLITPDGAQAIGEFVDYQIKQAQLDNLQTQNKVMEQDASLRTLQVVGAMTNNQRTALDLDREKDLFQTSVDAVKQDLLQKQEQTRKTRLDANYTHAQNIRADIDSQNKTAETVERILSSQLGRKEAEIRMSNLLKDGRIKELEARLSDMGISPSTPWYAKAVLSFLKNMDESLFQKLK